MINIRFIYGFMEEIYFPIKFKREILEFFFCFCVLFLGCRMCLYVCVRRVSMFHLHDSSSVVYFDKMWAEMKNGFLKNAFKCTGANFNERFLLLLTRIKNSFNRGIPHPLLCVGVTVWPDLAKIWPLWQNFKRLWQFLKFI